MRFSWVLRFIKFVGFCWVFLGRLVTEIVTPRWLFKKTHPENLANVGGGNLCCRTDMKRGYGLGI